jgi:hypothetical protein
MITGGLVRRHFVETLAGLSLGLLAAGARADGPAAEPVPCSHRGDYVLPIAPWAQPSNTMRYDGYYVGGGAPFCGEPRYFWEGTWGWDYIGCFPPRRVRLNWWHGRRYQGGTGSYKTDGPQCQPIGNPIKGCD